MLMTVARSGAVLDGAGSGGLSATVARTAGDRVARSGYVTSVQGWLGRSHRGVSGAEVHGVDVVDVLFGPGVNGEGAAKRGM